MIQWMDCKKHCITRKIADCEPFLVGIFANILLRKELCFALLSCLLLLSSSCLSLKLVLQLPENTGPETEQKPGKALGRLMLEYRISKALQNISNYPAPHDDIAPMPLPLWEWDFQSIAQQSPSITLISYAFEPTPETRRTQTGESQAIIQVALSFAGETDLRLLLGPEIQWRQQEFRWQLSAREAEFPDKSYPQLSGNLSAQEDALIQKIFAGETLDIIVSQNQRAGQGSPKSRKIEETSLAMSDFLTGKQNISIYIGK